ncbi:MAG: ABC transporter ATP-binding protein [Clostridiales bacterium]|nr:ABC transporter ATP-binding protein [Clostridiales bacterium]
MTDRRNKPKNGGKTLLRLCRYLMKHRLKLCMVVLLVLINTISAVGGNYYLRPVINNYIVPGNIKGLIGAMFVLLLIYLSGVVSLYLQNYIMIDVSQETVNDLRQELFSKVQELPVRFFDTTSHGQIMSRFTNDIDNISESLNNSITQILSSIFTVTGILCLMLFISPLLTLVTLVMVPLMRLIAKTLMKKSRAYFSSQQKALGEIDGYMEEVISGEKVVKVFSFEDNVEKEFNKLNSKLNKYSFRAQLYSQAIMPIMVSINAINYALTAAVGGILAVKTGLDFGGLMVFLQYSRQFGRPINELANQANAIQSALAGAERIFEIMDVSPERDNSENPVELKNVKGYVVFDHVTFSYDHIDTILKDISLYAKPGQKIALVGATGAGKTTITNLLTGFYDVDKGNIYIDGIDINNIKKDSLRKSLAMVLQDTHLFSGTIMENIRYGRLDATDEKVIKAAKLAYADSFIRRLPHGYDTVIEGDGSNLSQGQRQLLNIARAAIADPPILILDEATSSVDTMTERNIQKGMDGLMRGRTTFVIAHRLSTVRNADAIMVLDHGQIIERGSHEELLKQKGIYYKLYTGAFELE